MVELEVVGGGKMGEALIGGLLQGGWATAEQIRVVEPSAERRAQLADLFPGIGLAEAPQGAPGVILAVKPMQIAGVCKTLPSSGGLRVLSIAAGVTIETLEANLPSGTAVVRAMPNTPALVGAGASAISGGSHVDVDDMDWADGILSAVGIVVRVPEPLLDAVTGLSGSGPAYVFLIAEALIDAGVLVGLPRDMARALAGQTLLGAGKLLVESSDDAATLRGAVTSPGGTTAAGIQVLEQAAVRAAMVDAVRASAARAAELGRT